MAACALTGEFPMFVIVAGLPWARKSTPARALAQRLGGAVLDKDEIRAALFHPPLIEYSVAQDDFARRLCCRLPRISSRKMPAFTFFWMAVRFAEVSA